LEIEGYKKKLLACEQMETKQEIWTLIRSLFSSQLVFIMRTHKPSVITELIDDYELFVRKMLELHVDDLFWEEMQLKIGMVGQAFLILNMCLTALI